MKVVTDLSQINSIDHPIALTIGVYDGVHLGHQNIFKEVYKQTRKKGFRAVLTFAEHPATLLRPDCPTPMITTLEHRLHLLKSYGFDLAIVLPFDQHIANLSYETFIHNLREALPFDHLILGSDASFGKDRQGTSAALRQLGKTLNFNVTYLTKLMYQRAPISSGRIRTLIAEGDLKKIKKLLGRPYSIYAPFSEPIQNTDNQYRFDLQLHNLCLLPSAVYAVDIGTIPGIAFLKGSHDILGRSSLSLSITVDQPIPSSSYLDIKFVSYLYNELDPNLSQPSSLLKRLSLQPNPF